MSDNILEMRGITKTFPGVKALQDVSITVQRGHVHAICGENGAGKSTLMKVLSGVYPHGSYDGEILLDGEPVAFKSINESEHAGVVIIHQELALSPYLSIAENIFLGNERQSGGWIDWNTTNQEAAKLLASVGLKENPATKIADIGVGKQQLVEIAKALSKSVRLLILDEPTAALNDDDSAHMLELITHLRDEGITSIIISHKLNEIRAIADEVTVIRDGRNIETLEMRTDDVSEDRIIRGMVGRDLASRFPDRTPKIGDELLRIEDWTVHHPLDHERKVVDGANLFVREGEIVGIAGIMGAGRTELAMSVFGRSYGVNISGRVYKRGSEISTKTVSDAIDHGLAYATEDRKRFGLNLIDDVERNIWARLRDRGPEAVRAEPHRRRRAEHHDRRPRPDRESRLGQREPRADRRGVVPQEHEHQDQLCRGGRRQALRRQPAEGRALEMDEHVSRRADPRRAHAGHRCGREVRDLRHHQQARE